MGTPIISASVMPASLIKPQLKNISGSRESLQGVIIERDLELLGSETDRRSGPGTKHVLVLPSRATARLEWTATGRRRESLYKPGDLILNPAGYAAEPRWNTQMELVLFAIDPAHLVQVAEEAGARPSVEVEMNFHFEDKLIEELLRTLIRQYEQAVPADSLYTESLAQALLMHLIQTRTNTLPLPRRRSWSNEKPRLRRAIEFIQENLAETLSLGQIAREADLSSSQFCQVFKASTGLSPHQYVLRQRLDRAVTLLNETTLPISDIAVKTGFADQSHLTRVMRQHRSFTPGQIRRQLLDLQLRRR